MKAIDRHPPADRRCQIYVTGPELSRCRNEGDHWVKWNGCECGEPDPDICEDDFFSWECAGEHAVMPFATGGLAP